jgi:hypothetical protein
MNDNRLLTPHEAEAVVDDRIQQFGLGSLPKVVVTEQADGSWQVKWEDLERVVPPMTMDDWRAWLTENVGSLDAGDLETTES